MKTQLLLPTILLFAFATTNTFGQIPNSGFENWTNFGAYMEANGWSSTNSLSAGTFYPVTRASDPYPTTVGSYSIRIENKPSLLPNYEAIGFVWTNLITDLQTKPAFPITGHPTSLTGYYKWLPQNGDTMYINVQLFQGGVTVANGKMTATTAVSSWTSFNIPISAYTSADSATIILASYNADGPQYIPHGNSVLNIDNLNFDTLITTGISDVNETSKISVYPNPFSTETTLQTDQIFKDATFTVYNSFGQTARQIKNISGQTITLQRDNLPSGLYFIRLTEDNKTITADKLIITD